jgi:hypothetical protein
MKGPEINFGSAKYPSNRQAGEQPPEPVLQAMAAAGCLSDDSEYNAGAREVNR